MVEDENHKPVAGATVFFTVSSGSSGAGGSFLNSANTFSGQTDSNGRITATGFHPNGLAGKFRIDVTASKGQFVSHTTITQTNVFAVPGSASVGERPRAGNAAPKPRAPTVGTPNEYSLGDELQRWKKGLETGAVEYRIPGVMTAQQISTVTEVIHGYQDTQNSTMTDRTGSGILKVSSRIKAELLAPLNPGEFTIAPQGKDLSNSSRTTDSRPGYGT